MFGALLASLVLVGVGARLGVLLLAWTEGAGRDDTTALAYGSAGPHPVGLRAVAIGGAHIDGLLWYPATGPHRQGTTYAAALKAFDGAPLALATYRGHATRGAEADGVGGPYPLVVLSPAYAFGTTTYGWLAEHLASHGFVVLAIEHREVLDPSLLWRATIDRPDDVVAALDAAATTGWGIPIDMERVAVIGHSYGGYAALSAVGARIDPDRLRETCAAAAGSEDPIAFLCDSLAPRLDDMAEAAGQDGAGSGLWLSWGDDRVDVAIALAGDAVMFGGAGMAAVAAPLMTIGGTADRDAPYRWGTQLAYTAAESPRKVMIGLEGAEHMIFTGPCERRRMLLSLLPAPFCADPAWDRAVARDVTRHFTTAFLLAELSADVEAATTLSPGSVSVPAVTYAATGY